MFSIPAELGVIQAENPHALTRCLDLPGLAVTHLTLAPGLGVVFLAVRSTAPTAACPTCQQARAQVHQYHTRRVRDLPWADRRAYLLLERRRFKCAACRSPFTEALLALAPHGRTTHRSAAALADACRGASIQQVARQEAHGYKAVEAGFYRAAVAAHPVGPPPRLIKRLGSDEIAARKGQGHYKLVLVDLDTHQVLEQLADRAKATLRGYLASWSAEQRAAVEEGAVDFGVAYHDVAAELLPGARVVGTTFMPKSTSMRR